MKKITIELSDAAHQMLVDRCPIGKNGLSEMVKAILSSGEEDFVKNTFFYACQLGLSVDFSAEKEQEFNRVNALIKKNKDLIVKNETNKG
jgi:hypothetical protein